MKKLSLFTAVLVSLIFASTTKAQTKTRIRFARGATSAVVTGTIRGFAYRDYIVKANASQTIDVRLGRNTQCYFTIFKPDGNNLDLGVERDEFTSELPDSGDYMIRVLMMRDDARRQGSVSNYRLTISIR
jgi:hypothetical protein